MSEKTKNYHWFINHPKNRISSVKHVDELVKRIEMANHLDANPIIVTDYNPADDDEAKDRVNKPKFFVLQGAHRLAAAQRLDLDIYYIYKSDLGLDDVKHLNTVKSWTTNDWLEFHIDKLPYRHIKDIITDYRLPFGVARNIVEMNNASSKETLVDGLIKCPDWETSKRVAWHIRHMADNLPSDKKKTVLKTAFVRAVITLINVGGYDIERIAHKVITFPHKLTPCSTAQIARQVIIDLYKYRQRKVVK